MVVKYEVLGYIGGEPLYAPAGGGPPTFTPPTVVPTPAPTESAGARGLRLAREAREIEEGLEGIQPVEEVTVRAAEEARVEEAPPEPEITLPAFTPPSKELPAIDIKTREGYEAYQELPGKEQFGVLVGAGLVPEGAEYVSGLNVDWSLSGLSQAEIAERETRMTALTGMPATGWGYLTAEQLAEQKAAQEELERRQALQLHAQEVVQTRREEEYAAKQATLVPLESYKTATGYNLAGAFAAGLGADVYAARDAGWFTTEQIAQAQFGQIGVSGQERAQAEILRVAPGAITTEGEKTLVNLDKALAGGVAASTLRLAGFSAGAVGEAATRVGPVVPEVAGLVAPSIPSLLFGGPAPTVGGIPTFSEEQKALIPRFLAGKETPTFKSWVAEQGFDRESYVSMLREKGIPEADIPQALAATWNELQATYEYEHGLGRWGTTLGQLEKWSVEKPYAAMGAVALPIALATSPLWVPAVVPTAIATTKLIMAAGGIVTVGTGLPILGKGLLTPEYEIDVTPYRVDTAKIGSEDSLVGLKDYLTPTLEGVTITSTDYGRLVEDLGTAEASAALARAGFKPTIPLEVYEKLSIEEQAVYTPTEHKALAYQEGLLGAYGRGIEELWTPAMEAIRGEEGWSGWGIPRQLGAGLLGYAAPHEIVSELYPSKGALSLIALTPHFGPTAGVASLTIGEVPIWQTAMGYGAAVLPYAIGPAGTVLGKVGGVVAKVPVLGPTLQAVTAPIRWSAGVAQKGAAAIKLEQWAPWRAAYEVSGLAGKAGLARVSGLGPAGAKWGWWPSKYVPSIVAAETAVKAARLAKLQEAEAAIRAKPFERVYIDIEKAMKGPQYTTPPEAPYVPKPGEVKIGTSWYKPGTGWQPGEGIGGTPIGAPSAIVQPVRVAGGWEKVTQFLQKMSTTAPQVLFTQPYIKPLMYAGAIGAPLALLAMPAVSGVMATTQLPAAVTTTTLVQRDIAVVDQMLVQQQITPVQHAQIITQIEALQAQKVAPTVYQQEVQTIVQQQLTIPQQKQLVQQQEVAQIAIPVEVSVETLAKTDIAVVDRMLVEELITPVQHEQVVSQIEELQAQEVTTSEYAQQIQDIVQEQLNVVQQQQMETVEQQVVQQQVQEVQVQIVAQQDVLQDMIEQNVQDWQIVEQIAVVEALQTEIQDIIQQQQITEIIPPLPPPPPPLIPIIPPIPWLPGGVLGGGGFARGFRGARLGYGLKEWTFPETFISMPDPWRGKRKKIVIGEERRVPWGAEVVRTRKPKAKKTGSTLTPRRLRA